MLNMESDLVNIHIECIKPYNLMCTPPTGIRYARQTGCVAQRIRTFSSRSELLEVSCHIWMLIFSVFWWQTPFLTQCVSQMCLWFTGPYQILWERTLTNSTLPIISSFMGSLCSLTHWKFWANLFNFVYPTFFQTYLTQNSFFEKYLLAP